MTTNIYRKKPVEIEAMQVAEPGGPLIDWLNEHLTSTDPEAVHAHEWSIDPDTGGVLIGTLEGVMLGRPGWWIIRGVQSEFYPCDPDIFAATYEQVGDDERRAIEYTPEYETAAARFFTASNRPDVVDLRTRIVALGAEIDRLVPGGRNKALALTALEDVQMRANRGLFAPEAHR